MKTLFALAAVMLAQPASAGEMTWVAADCGQFVMQKDGNFTMKSTGASKVVAPSCKVDYWPISTPVAEMKCSDGKYLYMQLYEDGSIKYDNVMLYPKGDKRVLCD